MRGLNHGNALSIYCLDPEDNTVEVYLDTPWYVSQPHGDPLDLDQDDAAIWADTERIVRTDPSFMPVAEWSRASCKGAGCRAVARPELGLSSAPAKRSVARISRSRMPGSVEAWPASSTMWNSASGQALCSAQA